MAIDQNNQYQLPFSAYAQQAPRYTPDLESTILNMFGQYGVDVSRYGGGAYADPAARLQRIANELRTGQRSFTDVERSLQLAASENTPEQRRAYQTAAYEFNPQWQQLNRALEQLGIGRARDTDMAQRFSDWGRQAIGNTYENLQGDLTENRAATQAGFDTARQGITGAFDQSRQMAETGREAAMARNAGLAASLGVRDAIVDPNAELNNAVSQMLAQQGTEQAAATGTLDALASAISGINTQAISDAGMESALMQDRHALQASQMLNDILGGYMNQEFDVMGQLNDLEASRGGRIAELINQFQDQSYDRSRQEMLDQLAAEIQRGTLALQQQELGFNREQFQQEMGLNWAQFGLDRQDLELRRMQIQGELAQTMDPDRRRQLQLENMLLEQQLAGGGATMGSEAANNYLSGFSGPYAQGQDPATVFNSLRTAAMSAAMNDPRYGGDPFSAFEYLLSTGSNPNPAIADILRRAGELYWGATQ